MRVALVTSLAYGGPLEQAKALARGLSAAGVEVRVACASDHVARQFEGVAGEVAVLPLRSQVDVAGAVRVARFAGGADVVHAHDRRSGLWVRTGPRPRRGGIRVYTVHGLPTPYLPPPVGGHRSLRDVLAYRGLDAALCRRADAVVTPSHAVARVLEDDLGYPAARMAVVPNGVEVPPEPPPPSGSLIGTVAMLEPVKGLEVFLRAAAELARDRPDLRFAMFGVGSQRDRLGELAAQLGLGDRLELPGQVPAKRAFERLSVFVLSSWMENCPMALLEAMAAGVPAVATRVGGVPEIVVDGTAQLTDRGDAHAIAAGIGRLLDDAALRRAQVERARTRVAEHFDSATCTQAMLDLYGRLLARRGRR